MSGIVIDISPLAVAKVYAGCWRIECGYLFKWKRQPEAVIRTSVFLPPLATSTRTLVHRGRV